MIFDSWINDFDEGGVATMCMQDERRVCTFCDEPGVAVVIFGKYMVHLCEVHAHE